MPDLLKFEVPLTFICRNCNTPNVRTLVVHATTQVAVREHINRMLMKCGHCAEVVALDESAIGHMREMPDRERT